MECFWTNTDVVDLASCLSPKQDPPKWLKTMNSTKKCECLSHAEFQRLCDVCGCVQVISSSGAPTEKGLCVAVCADYYRKVCFVNSKTLNTWALQQTNKKDIVWHLYDLTGGNHLSTRGIQKSTKVKHPLNSQKVNKTYHGSYFFSLTQKGKSQYTVTF